MVLPFAVVLLFVFGMTASTHGTAAARAAAGAGVLSLCPIADHLNEDADKQDPNRRGKKNGWPHSVIPFFFGGVDRPFTDQALPLFFLRLA